MKLLTAAQMRDIDCLTTERFGVPSLQLMENAGSRVVEFLEERYPDFLEQKIAVLCGKGNNGGDGFVVARLLAGLGARPQVFLFAEPDTVQGDAAVNLKRLREAQVEIRVVKDAASWENCRKAAGSAKILLDALLGTGLAGPVQGLLGIVIEQVNQFRPSTSIVAVDIPSGLPSDSGNPAGPAIFADATVTFTAPKLGQVLPPNCEHAGELLVRSIGSPNELLDANPALKFHWLEPGEFGRFLVRRKPASHKGDFGHSLIVAGSQGKTGAAVLAASGALRAGAGLVTVATPASVLPVVSSHLPEMMTAALLPTEENTISVRNLDYGRFFDMVKGKNVLAMGPGLSTNDETQQFVRAVVRECPLPVILDADGLNAFAGRAAELKEHSPAGLAVTPHPGEMARLLGSTTQAVQGRRLEVALEAAAAWNAIVVLKGFRTIVATPDGQAFINSTGNPGMASGGTGDVLTGILAGLTAQWGTQAWERVLSFGVYLHGLAGDIAARTIGEAPMIASDLVAGIPRAFHQLISGRGNG